MPVKIYDKMLRRLRDKGWMETEHIIESGIIGGHALEVGPGPGYLGLEWLKRVSTARLTGIDISPDMVRIASRNAEEYFLTKRTKYLEGNAMKMPFDDGYFNGVFTNGSLHEWGRADKGIRRNIPRSQARRTILYQRYAAGHECDYKVLLAPHYEA
jgi:ubiquinone/menaquinone biosynthesis C-methylase UbiE